MDLVTLDQKNIFNIDADNNEDQDLWYSHDFAMALGVKARVTKNDLAPIRTRVLKNVTPDHYTHLEMVVSSPMGPLRPLDKAVLTALTTMALSQTDKDKEKYFELKPELRGRFAVFFTLSDLCRKLGYDPNTMIREVKESLVRLNSQTVDEKTFKYSVKTKKIIDNQDNYKVIDQFGKIRVIKSDEGMSSLAGIFYVVLHPSVVFKMSMKTNIGFIDSADYHKLKGILKSVYEFICSKRDNFGKTYTFDIAELCGLLGLDGTSYKNRDSVKKYLDQIKTTIGGIDFNIIRDSAKDTYNVIISFKETEDEDFSDADPFYKELLYAYGIDKLQAANFSMDDLGILRFELKLEEFSKKNNRNSFSFNGFEADPVEFAIDIALFQIIHVPGFKVTTTTRNFIKFLYSEVCAMTIGIPGGYSKFLTVRNAAKRKSERQLILEQEILKREQSEKETHKNIQSTFDDFWNDRINKDPVFVAALEQKAETELRLEDPHFDQNMLKNSLIRTRAKETCFKIYQENPISFATFAEKTVKEMKKLKAEDITPLLSGINPAMITESSVSV